MIIEFSGNTGAGKSTLVPILTQLLRDADQVARTTKEAIYHYTARTRVGQVVCSLTPAVLRGPALWRLFSYGISRVNMVRFASKNPQLVRHVVSSQLRRPIPWRHKWLILRLFFRMAGEYHFLTSQAQAEEILVFDEGFVHRAVHMFVSESEQPDPRQIISYLGLLPRSDLVVWVSAAPDTCLARIHARGLQKRLRGLTAKEVERFVEHSAQVVNVAVQYIKQAGWSVVEIANEGDLSVCSAELHQAVSLYLLGPASTLDKPASEADPGCPSEEPADYKTSSYSEKEVPAMTGRRQAVYHQRGLVDRPA
jgi:thymidylate kinase